MTRAYEELKVEEKTVVVFDIRSSSSIVENLTMTGNLRALRNLLIAIKKFLGAEAHTIGFEVYQFTGDGWIMLFPSNVKGRALFDFLLRLSRLFREEYKKRILPVMEIPSSLGLRFGIDRGKVVRLRMFQKTEYIGRPLNVATRLQAAAEESNTKSAYTVLLSRPAYKSLGSLQRYNPEPVRKSLGHILGETPYRCIRVELPV